MITQSQKSVIKYLSTVETATSEEIAKNCNTTQAVFSITNDYCKYHRFFYGSGYKKA